jgi:hypothetical protein
MSEIQSVNHGPTTTGPMPSVDDQHTPVADGGGQRVDGAGQVRIDGNGVVIPRGFNLSNNDPAPGLFQVKIDPALMITMLTEVFSKLDENQSAAFMKQLQNAEPMFTKILQSRIDESNKRYKNFIDTRAAEKKSQISSDVQLGVGVALTVLGVIATILTAGALSGFMIAGMVLSATMTTSDVINRGLKAGKVEYDDPFDKTGKTKKPLDISIGGLMKMAVEADFASGNHSYPPHIDKKDEKAMAAYRESWVLGTSVALTAVVTVLSIGLGVGAFRAAKNMGDSAMKAGEMFKNIAPKIADFARENVSSIQMVNQSLEMAGDVINLTTSVYQGTNTIVMAKNTFEMRMAEANLNQLSSYADIMNADFGRIQQGAKDSAEDIGDTKKSLADQISMLLRSNSQIIAIT